LTACYNKLISNLQKLFDLAVGNQPLNEIDMPQLNDIATVVRSKNAGPLTLSFDLMFSSEESFAFALASSALSPERIGQLYDTEANKVQVTPYPAARAIKIALPRKIVSGSPGDRDVYGAQQHVPLLGIEL
jgi:hypothetical protein